MMISSIPARRIWLALFALATAAVVATVLLPPISPAIAAAEENQARRPVLVELFTSEGCSSCPPADALLAQLDAQQFVPGVLAIVLSEHVTYWNHEGWEDPFSFDAITDRQNQYGRHFGLESVYTPQAVVDGAAQVTGSDGHALSLAIAKAAELPALDLAIEDAGISGAAVHFKVRLGNGSSAQNSATNVSNVAVTAALADDSAESSVKRGENSGRTLRHVAVVRAMGDMGKGALSGRDLALKLPSAGQSGALRLVVFATDRHSGRVLGVTERTLTR
jgi:hypothetical protein